jgi:hypothetical protein
MAIVTHTFYDWEALPVISNQVVDNIYTHETDALWGQGFGSGNGIGQVDSIWRTIELVNLGGENNKTILEITLNNTVPLKDMNFTFERKKPVLKDNTPVLINGIIAPPRTIPAYSFNQHINLKYKFRIKMEHLSYFHTSLSFTLGLSNGKICLVIKYSPIVVQMVLGNNIVNGVTLGSGGVKIPRYS